MSVSHDIEDGSEVGEHTFWVCHVDFHTERTSTIFVFEKRTWCQHHDLFNADALKLLDIVIPESALMYRIDDSNLELIALMGFERSQKVLLAAY